MPRFVILEHDWPYRHWDLMLESGGVLRSWRLAEPPRRHMAVVAEPIGDHRLDYLDYEGPVSGGRGRVVRLDGGELQWLTDAAGQTSVMVRGQMVRGRLDIGDGRCHWE